MQFLSINQCKMAFKMFIVNKGRISLNYEILIVLLHCYSFKFCLTNLVEAWYSLEQYIGFEGRQAFIHYCGLHQV